MLILNRWLSQKPADLGLQFCSKKINPGSAGQWLKYCNAMKDTGKQWVSNNIDINVGYPTPKSLMIIGKPNLID